MSGSHVSRGENILVSTSGRHTLQPSVVPVVDVSVCRICFATDCKMYTMTTYTNLSQAYETLTGLLLEDDVNLPLYLCSECARRLMNYARFRTTTIQAHSMLLDMVQNHGRVTLELINSVKGIHSTLSSNETDYDLDIELSNKENLYTGEQAGIRHSVELHEDIDVDRIEVENNDVIHQDDFNTENAINADMVRMSSLHEDVDIGDIKAENSDIINQDEFIAEDAPNAGLMCMSNMQEDIGAVVVKVENNDIIDQDYFNTEAATNAGMVCMSNTQEGIDRVFIKAETDCVTNQYSINENLIDIKVEHESAFSSEPPVAEATEKVRLNATGLQEMCTEASNNAHQNPGADGGLLVHSNLCCEICPYQTKYKQNLVRHSKTHSSAVSYSCNMCSYKTPNRSDLTYHLSTHFIKKLFWCKICNKAFYPKRNLITHVRIHTGEKPFSCNVCHKAFTQNSNLITHMRIHTGEKLFTCIFCNKAFNVKDSLIKHSRIHTGEKPFSCDICNKAFNQKPHLCRHMRIHSGEKSFSSDT